MQTQHCIIVISDKDKKDSPVFENEVKRALNPSKNKLCLCFMHRIPQQELNGFDNLLKKKKPTLLLFSGVHIDQLTKLACRAQKRFPSLKILSDTTTQSPKVQLDHIKTISYELIAPSLTREELAVAV